MCVTIAVIICFITTGCNKGNNANIPKDSPYIGTWESTETEIDGIKGMIISKGKHIITLKANGTAVYEMIEEKGKANWEITEDGVKLTGDLNTSLKYNNGNLYEYFTDITYIYKKQ